MRLLLLMLLTFTANADYIKIANDGSQLPDSAQLGSGAKDWACTYDTKSNLLWEVKLNSNGEVRWMYATYSWSPTNYGNSGLFVDEYVSKINSIALCNRTDWDIPEDYELHTILYCDVGVPIPKAPSDASADSAECAVSGNVKIGNEHFPNTLADNYWTKTAATSATFKTKTAVDFKLGEVNYFMLSTAPAALRLVNRTPIQINKSSFNSSGELNLHAVEFNNFSWDAKLQQQPDGLFKLLSVKPTP